jgi:thiamine-phosphate pyrophosphorylase
MDNGVFRIIDANINRATEGVRVCEDILRFALNNEDLTRKLKTLRHDIFSEIKQLRNDYIEEMVLSRDSVYDVGIKSSKSEKRRDNLGDLFFANVQRGKESLRVLEEVLKLFDEDLSQKYKKFRFSLYGIERTAIKDLEELKENNN